MSVTTLVGMNPANDNAGPTISLNLSRGLVAVIDEKHADLAEFKWSAQARKDHAYAHRSVWSNGKARTLLLHKVILERKLGRPLQPGEQTDHINRDWLDNREENLRLATKTQNCRNRGLFRNSASGLKGVSSSYRKYRARITVDGQTINLGLFETAELAAFAYNLAAVQHFGEFAQLNEGVM